MQYHDVQYLTMLRNVQNWGTLKADRTGTGTISLFDYTMTFDLSDLTIPLLTTKKMHLPSIIHELLWFISGSTNNNDLRANKVNIWNAWADEQGELGPIYGKMLRDFNGVDQLQSVIDILKTDPDSRRMYVSYWDASLLPDPSIPPHENATMGKQALPPCHVSFQLYTRELTPKEQHKLGTNCTRALSMKLIMRSNDVFLGNPFNIAQYSMLLHMICHVCGMYPDKFIWSGGDVHLYTNHVEQVNTQLTRGAYPSPKLVFNRPINNINDFTYDDFYIVGYEHHDAIKAPVAV
jgi:thymidylate synthase